MVKIYKKANIFMILSDANSFKCHQNTKWKASSNLKTSVGLISEIEKQVTSREKNICKSCLEQLGIAVNRHHLRFSYFLLECLYFSSDSASCPNFLLTQNLGGLRKIQASNEWLVSKINKKLYCLIILKSPV